MRHPSIVLAGAALVLFALTPAASSQPRYPIKIDRVQAGFPAGPFSSSADDEGGKRPIFRPGSWTPIWVEVECQARYEEALEIVVETTDVDSITTVARVPLIPPMQPGERRNAAEMGVIPYLKPGQSFGDLTVSIRTSRGKTMAEPHKRSLIGIEPGKYVVLSIGASLNGLWLSRGEGTDAAEPTERNRELRGGQVQLAEILDVGRMPDQWIGYQGVDLVLLTTGADASFWDRLGRDRRRLTALAEWVRRGGRLIVSAGVNADRLSSDQLPEIRDMLPAVIPAAGRRSERSLRLLWVQQNPGQAMTLEDANPREPSISVAALTPRADRSARPLMPTLVGNNVDWSRPLIVQGAYGLGKVTLVGFDLDRAPMTEWPGRAAFWERLLTEGGQRLPKGDEKGSGQRSFEDSEELYVRHLQEMLDSFEGVPVVSFGWVALFILLYIILIGPVDYYFLKKVVKRMEWTWITFPLIVIVVSGIAYFTAYALKGRDLKVNKVDVVDIDLQSNRIYGHTYFTVFSPRIQSYTVGVEPAGPRPGDAPGKKLWTSDSAADSLPNTAVSWFGRSTSHEANYLRRSYRYYSDPSNPEKMLFACGMEQVPIQVWSTKAFTAAWSARIDPNAPLIEHNLRHPHDNPDQLTGTITSHLPVEVRDEAFLLYRERAIPLGQLVPGVQRTVIQKASDPSLQAGLKIGGNEPGGRLHSYDNYRGRNVSTPLGTYSLWSMLFHDTTGSGSSQLNASVRSLDQSWRVGELANNTAILVLRVPIAEDTADAMTEKPQSPTRLWLNAVPGTGAPHEKLQGTLRQETYIRVFIPVLPNK